MSADTRDLDTQIAVHLFGWQWLDGPQLWRDPDGLVCDAAAFRRRLPAYSRVPDATARVWQWLETQEALHAVAYAYWIDAVTCTITLDPLVIAGTGASWPEALCRAALALAEALEKGEGER